MSRQERQEVVTSIKKLNGKIQSSVNRKTTHIILGDRNYTTYCSKCNSPDKLLSQMLTDVVINDHINKPVRCCVCRCDVNASLLDQRCQGEVCDGKVKIDKPRTINTLLGAVRGCRVLYSKWVFDSLRENRWIHHCGYEVRHLKRIYEVRLII